MKSFSLETAWVSALWSELAYGDGTPPPANKSPRWSPSPGSVTRLDNKETDIHALFAELDGCNILAFRGTHSLHNFFTDAAVQRVEWGPRGMLVHRGFLEAYLSIDSQVATALRQADVKPLYITGHSLGAALAMICAAALVYYYPPHHAENVVGIYGFGTPRWTNARGAHWFNHRWGERVWRVVDCLDPIAHMPWLMGRYRHTRHEAWITPGYTLEFNRIHPWEFILAQLAEWKRGELVPMPDHEIGRYRVALDEVK
jgi:hypothetical protein